MLMTSTFIDLTDLGTDQELMLENMGLSHHDTDLGYDIYSAKAYPEVEGFGEILVSDARLSLDLSQLSHHDLYVLSFKDNSQGEGDIEKRLGVYRYGEWYSPPDSDNDFVPLLQYQGDEILVYWKTNLSDVDIKVNVVRRKQWA